MKTVVLRNVKIETSYKKESEIITGTETESVDIQIANGMIRKVIPTAKHPIESDEIDGKGSLVLPAIRESHCHFDKGKLGVPWQPITPAESIVERFTSEAEELAALPITFSTRMKKFIELELQHGVTYFRSHVDIFPKIGLKNLENIQEVLEEYKGMFSYELVAFPQHGLLYSEAYGEMKRALENGADLVGGLDPSSLDRDLERSLNQTFDLATQFNVPIDLHIHDRGAHGRKTFDKLIELTKEAGWENRVTVSHAFGLNDIDSTERAQLFHELAESGIAIISSVPLSLGTIPPLEELREAGVEVSLGCDNVYDSWSPFGDGNVLEKLNRYVELFDLTTQKGLTDSLKLVTGISTVGNEGRWLKEGMQADFILVESSCSAEFVARKSPIFSRFYKGEPFYIGKN